MDTYTVDKHGFEMCPSFFPSLAIDELRADIALLGESRPSHGVRNAEQKIPALKSWIDSDLLRSKARTYLCGEPQFVRAIVFDKTPEKNWLVAWHQDRTIALKSTSGPIDITVPGWGPWSIKDGVHHVQPSLDVLDEMITLRIHLDDTSEENGCLKVIAQSHRLGILNHNDLAQHVEQSAPIKCIAKAGDLLIMRPHLLHASSKGCSPSQRRVLHIEYSSFNLPEGFSWN